MPSKTTPTADLQKGERLVNLDLLAPHYRPQDQPRCMNDLHYFDSMKEYDGEHIERFWPEHQPAQAGDGDAAKVESNTTNPGVSLFWAHCDCLLKAVSQLKK
jgi:hypothetical protein